MRKTTQDLRSKSAKELQKEAEQIKSEIAKLQLEFKSNMPKDTNSIMKKRRRMAVILTVLNEKRETEDITNEK